jgi:hypothetical protein
MSDFLSSAAVDVDELKRRIRELAAIRRGGPMPEPPEQQPAGADWSAVLAGLAWAENHADLVHAEPAMRSFPGLLRPLARLLGRIVGVLSRFLTRQQTDCNNATLTALHLLGVTVRHRLDELDRRVAALEHQLEESGSARKRARRRSRPEACG